MVALAEQLAANPLVRSQLVQPAPQRALAPLVNSTQTQSGVTSVTVADADGRIVGSTNPTAIGAPLSLGGGADEGRGWSGSLTVDGGRELVAQVPVLGATQEHLGEQLGTVMIGEADPTVWQRLSGASSYLLAYLGIASALGVAAPGCWPDASNARPSAWNPARSPGWPSTGRRCCTASQRAWSPWTRTSASPS